MNLRQVRTEASPGPDASELFGKPYETADGATVIPVARTRGRTTGSARPLGVFVVKDGRATWRPAIDSERVALMGILVGLISVALTGVAMVRRPPWPDLRGDISRSR
ncbi:hypothetical protein [Mycobacterium deserti]|uniref:Sporulation protein n=1 Tax=Mycobacterium deserti TaxID=2978347 RepID=A0ABT2MI52_9MYCO|nr:hypothetical protein [Mycobacterium deserti]MCT7661897.1 hypothetical protein [Mycobacterium deserti]